MSSNLNCPSCGIVTVVIIDAKVRTSGVACYCAKCDSERAAMIRKYSDMLSKEHSSKAANNMFGGDVFGDIFGGGKFK